MHEPARFVAREVTAAGRPGWLYRFGYVAESRGPTGTAEHAKELPFLFGTLEIPYGAAVTPRDRAMGDLFMAYVAAFARTGDPSSGGLPSWPPYDPANDELMMFTADGGAVVRPDPWSDRLDLVARAVEARAALAALRHRRPTLEPGPGRSGILVVVPRLETLDGDLLRRDPHHPAVPPDDDRVPRQPVLPERLPDSLAHGARDASDVVHAVRRRELALGYLRHRCRSSRARQADRSVITGVLPTAREAIGRGPFTSELSYTCQLSTTWR
jgi:hypothetical protein